MKNILSHHVQKTVASLRRQPVVRRFRQRHPRLARFVAGRFSTHAFMGLPLTLVLVVFAVNAALLSELAEDVLESEGLVTFDQRFTMLLYSVRSEWLSRVFYTCTKLGERETVFIIGGVTTAVLLYKRRFVAILAFWLVQAGMGLTVQYGKTFISRSRPADVAYYTVEHFSFPSGHATTAVALYGMLAYLLFRYLSRPGRRLALVLAAVLIVIVGFSRIYLGVHFLSDVLAGFLLGALWLLVGISLVEVMVHRQKKTLPHLS